MAKPLTKNERLLYPKTTSIDQDASFLRRTTAFIFDLLLLDILVTTPFTPVFERMMSRIETGDLTAMTYSQKELGAVMLLFIIIYAYFVLFEYALGQTPGMMLLNTTVTGSTGLANIMLRNSIILPVFPFIAFWAIEPIAILFWKRGVVERLTNTRTAHRRKIYV